MYRVLCIGGQGIGLILQLRALGLFDVQAVADDHEGGRPKADEDAEPLGIGRVLLVARGPDRDAAEDRSSRHRIRRVTGDVESVEKLKNHIGTSWSRNGPETAPGRRSRCIRTDSSLLTDGGRPPSPGWSIQPTRGAGQQCGCGVQWNVGSAQRDEAEERLRQEPGDGQDPEEDRHPPRLVDCLTGEVGTETEQPDEQVNEVVEHVHRKDDQVRSRQRCRDREAEKAHESVDHPKGDRVDTRQIHRRRPPFALWETNSRSQLPQEPTWWVEPTRTRPITTSSTSFVAMPTVSNCSTPATTYAK